MVGRVGGYRLRCLHSGRLHVYMSMCVERVGIMSNCPRELAGFYLLAITICLLLILIERNNLFFNNDYLEK